MFERVFEIIISVISYIDLSIGSLSSFREGFVLRSGEYEISKEGSSIFESEKEKEEREKAAAFGAPAVSGSSNQVISNAQAFIQKINKRVSGLGTAIDIIFSPNTALIFGMIGVGMSFLTPLGPIVGAAAVAVSAALMITMVVIGALEEKARQIKKQTTTVVKELEKDIDGIAKVQEKLEAVNTSKGISGVDMKLVFSGIYSYQNHLGDLEGEKQASKEYSAWRAALQGLGARIPFKSFPLGMALATLNPVTVGLSVGMFIFSEASSIRVDQRNAKVKATHDENMAGIRTKIGLPELKGEVGLETYTTLLSGTKRAKMAMERFGEDYEKIIKSMADNGITPTTENLRNLLQEEYLHKQPIVKIPTQIPTFGEALGASISNGRTWSKAMTAQSPLIPEFEWAYNDNAYKYAAIREQEKAKTPDLNVRDLDRKTDEIAKQKGKSTNEKLGIKEVDIDKATEKFITTPEKKDPHYWENKVAAQKAQKSGPVLP